MKKKFAAIILAIAIVFSVAGIGAYADCPAGHQYYLTPAQQLCLIAAECAVDSCNRMVDAAVRCAQATPQNDVIPLLRTVDKLVNQTTIIVNALGFQVECCYTEYTVDGQRVLIDPLRVINPIETNKPKS